MPVYQFVDAAVDDLRLPSDPECVVVMKREATHGDANVAQRAMLAITPSATGVDLGAVDMGAYTNTLLCRLIKSWNLTDAEGALLPIIPESIDRLSQEDGAFLSEEAMKRVRGRSAAQQAPFETPSPTSSSQSPTTSQDSEQTPKLSES